MTRVKSGAGTLPFIFYRVCRFEFLTPVSGLFCQFPFLLGRIHDVKTEKPNKIK